HGKADRTAVNLFTCNGGKNQQWKLVTIQSGAAKGKTLLVDQNSQKCLDIKAASTANGTPLEIFTCNGGNNQAWAWGNGTTSGGGGGTGGGTVKDSGQLKSGLTAKQLCLDAKGNTAANGTIAQTYLCNSKDTAQQWKEYSDGTIKFT